MIRSFIMCVVLVVASIIETQPAASAESCVERLVGLMRTTFARYDTTSGYGMAFTVVNIGRAGTSDTSSVRIDHKGACRRVISAGSIIYETPKDIIVVMTDQKVILIRDGEPTPGRVDAFSAVIGMMENPRNVTCQASSDGATTFAIALSKKSQSPFRSVHVEYMPNNVLASVTAHYRDLRYGKRMIVTMQSLGPVAQDFVECNSAVPLVMDSNKHLLPQFNGYEVFDARATPAERRSRPVGR